MTAPAKAAPMREDVTQADRNVCGVICGLIQRELDDRAYLVAAAHRLAHTARPDAGDEDVERVARAISKHTWAEGTGTDDCGEWDDFTPHVKLIYRDAARAALAAMEPRS